jgi:hypothetical protein
MQSFTPDAIVIKWRRRATLVLTTCAAILLALLVWREARHGSQYRLGMSLDDALGKSGNVYKVHNYAFDTFGETEEHKQNEPYYYFYDERDGYLLEFNQYKRLISKKKVTWFGINPGVVREFFERRR